MMEPTCAVRGREVDSGGKWGLSGAMLPLRRPVYHSSHSFSSPPELFFLIARYLDGGPCQEAARVG